MIGDGVQHDNSHLFIQPAFFLPQTHHGFVTLTLGGSRSFCLTVCISFSVYYKQNMAQAFKSPQDSMTKDDWDETRQKQNTKYGWWLNDLGQHAKGPNDKEFGILEKMLKDGEPVDTVGGYGETALLRSMGRGIWVPLLLLQYGANPNFRCSLWDDMYGGTMLHMACKNDNLPLIKALLSVGADPTLTDRNGKTPQEVCKADTCANFIKQFIKNNGKDTIDIKSCTLQTAYSRVTDDK